MRGLLFRYLRLPLLAPLAVTRPPHLQCSAGLVGRCILGRRGGRIRQVVRVWPEFVP